MSSHCMMCDGQIDVCSEDHYLTSNMGEELFLILEQSVGHEVDIDGVVCQQCFPTLQSSLMSNTQDESIPSNQEHVCVCCRSALFRRRTHSISEGPERELIAARISPRQIPEGGLVCYSCWVYFSSLVQQNEVNLPTPRASSALQDPYVCVWCRRSLTRRRSHALLEGLERNEIAARISPRQIPNSGRVCYACWVAAQRNIRRQATNNDLRQIQDDIVANNEPNIMHDRNVCVWCESSLLHRRTHILGDGPERNMVMTRIFPREIRANALVCMGCWRVIQEAQMNPNSIAASEPTLQLDDFTHTTHSSAHCFVPGCTAQERFNVPLYLKKRILTSKKVFVTENARICQTHITLYNWDILDQFEFSDSFTKNEVQSLLKLTTEAEDASAIPINFRNHSSVSDNVFHYWTGVTKANYEIIFGEIPTLQLTCKRPRLALGLYLIKSRTGESHDRIASLFQISKALVSILLRKAREALTNDFVPNHLGVSHISRDELMNRNLLIPEGLFGDTSGDRKPIVICDGTYIYIQKSSNYLFQKKTYSTHKYRNLVKPFLIVATDGHIIDTFGPYAATKSDADIMKALFENDNGELRNYFGPQDIFILDRGFRDALPLLESLNYVVYKPESLEVGETQLSTLKANKSRCVTLCRWVVEVINGRFKRDFRILRNDFFNLASKHLMDDFRICASIINAFHQVIVDRLDAQMILDRAKNRIRLPNYLADYIILNNINRRRAHFHRIDHENEELSVFFPQMTMSDLILFALGTYQIKQARSYYGEHLRQHGSFVVEISSELEDTSIPELSSHDTVLLRGRIKSRHFSQKIYYTYVLLATQATGWEHVIKEYYCSCICGKRTVGTCAHVMTIVWFLGWARHDDNITAPATFLDDILVSEELDNDE